VYCIESVVFFLLPLELKSRLMSKGLLIIFIKQVKIEQAGVAPAGGLANTPGKADMLPSAGTDRQLISIAIT
jgi:hypothetical protein